MPMPVAARRRVAYVPPPVVPSKLLAEVAYDPGSTETKTVTSTTPQDADATNLAVTFTPTTSRVLLVLEGYSYASGTAGDAVHVSWNVRENSSDVFPHQRVGRTPERMRHRLSRVVTVTPDVQTTWKWGLRSSSASIGVNLTMGGGSSGIGPANMWVFTIPDGASELLALVQHNPDPAETPTTSSASYVDLDSDLAVTFTPPASGLVLVEAEAYASRRQKWTLRAGTTNLTTEDGATAGMQAISGTVPHRILLRLMFSNIVGEQTWKWGWARIIDTAEMFYGTDYGVAEMRVWAVEDQF